MGSVKDITVTGDNDPEIYPVEYYRHYMYCDKCGSFDIKAWIEPENHEQITYRGEWMEKLSWGFFASAVLSGVVGLICLAFTDAVDIAIKLFILMGISLLLGAGTMYLSVWITSKIKYPGVRCDECLTKYENGSPFFTDLDNNPLDYSMDSVPLPLNKTYWIRSAKD